MKGTANTDKKMLRCGCILYAAILSILLAVWMSGSLFAMDKDSQELSPAEGTFWIYYSNQEGTELIRKDFRPESKDFEGILKEVVDAFQKAPSTDVRSALPQEVKILSTMTGINEVDVDFSAEYLSLDTISEILLRGALVRTLLYLPGVDTVRFTVESQSLVIGEEEIGPMTEDTFIIPTGNGINSYRKRELILYYPFGDGTSVVRQNKTSYYSSNVNTERLVIEEMLKKPQGEDLLPVAVEGTLVQDVSVSNGYCIVDFSEEINNAPAGEVIANPETVLYAFANAIIDSCTEDRITGVRFRIKGSTDIRFRDQVNLDQVFSRNADVIYTPVVKLDESEPAA